VAEAEAERDLRQLLDLDVEVSGDRLHAFPDLALARAGEVIIPEVAFRERRLRPDRAGQRALVERHSHNHADARRLDGGEECVLGALVEDVVDHLNGVDEPRLDEPDRVLGLVVVDRDTEEADLPLALQSLDRVEPVALAHPLVGPDVELLDVDRLETEVLQAALGAGHDPVGREDLLWAQAGPGRPLHVLRRDLAGDVDRRGRLAHGGADQLLAVAVTVRVGGVEEVDAVLDREPESPQGFVVVGSDPPRPTDPPGSEAELGDLETCLAQRPVAHCLSFLVRESCAS
jgi:hypothetical protein